MKLFTEEYATEKTFSVKLSQDHSFNLIKISLVDSRSGTHLAHLAQLDGANLPVIVYSDVTDCLKGYGYKFNNDIFDKDGTISILRR